MHRRSPNPRVRRARIGMAALSAAVVLGLGVPVSGDAPSARAHDADASQTGPEPGPIVSTTAGPVRGVRDESVDRYRGIPYAAPPVGDARWKAPQPPDEWVHPRDATTSGSPCPQLGTEGEPLPEADEDCLYLDVTTPQQQADESAKPVMVWLHGGGNTEGSGSEFDPARMAAMGDVVVVTVNYRLGALGFFAHDGLRDSGSFGLQDQQAALHWVRENSGSFGGDPSDVTLFGQSAGSVDACAHLTSPAARGLFDKVILQSGSCETRVPTAPVGENVAMSRDDFWTPVDQLQQRGRQAAAELGCSAAGEGATGSHRDVLDCLRELPAEELLPYAATFGIASGTATLPKNPGEAVADGQFHRVPVLSGNTRDESRYTTMLVEAVTGPITAERYDTLLEQTFGDHAGTVRETYPLDEYDNPGLAFAAMDTDRTWACPQLTTARALAGEVPTYGYEFADRTAPTYGPFLTDMPPGAAHASELAYLFELAIGPWARTSKRWS